MSENKNTLLFSKVLLLGAELQNLLKLFGAIIDGQLKSDITVPTMVGSKEHIIY